MNKLSFFFIFFIICNNFYAQVVRELLPCNVLFRGHKTKFDIGFIGVKRDVNIRSSNSIIQKEGNSFFITAGKEKEVLLEVIDKHTDAVLRTETYLVEDSLVPTLFVEQNLISARYNGICAPKENFLVKEWTLISEKIKINGKGANILNDSILRIISANLEFVIQATVLNAKGNKFQISKKFNEKKNKLVNKFQNQFDGFVSIIDKNDATKHIFDYSDPFSLLSIITKSDLNGVEIIDSLVFKRILKENPGLNFSKIYKQKINADGTPSIKIDSTGNPVIVTNSDTGIDQLVLSDPEVFRYDLNDITRIVVFEDTIENIQTGKRNLEIIKLGFAKKYPNSNKYDLIFTIPYKIIKELDAFKTIVKLSDEEVKHLINDEKSFYFQLNNLNRGSINSLPKLIEVSDSIASVKSKNSEYSYLQCIISELYDVRKTINKYSYPQNHTIYNNVIPNQFLYPINFQDYIFANYSCESFYYQPTYPNGSPIEQFDPITGEILTEFNPKTGEYVKLIQEKRRVISYIYNDNPNIYLQYDFVYNDSIAEGNNNAYIESIIITRKDPELKGELITLKYNLYDKAKNKGRYGINLNFDPLIDAHVVKNYTTSLPCLIELNQQLKNRKKMNVNKSRVLKHLSESFNLDHISIIPLNLLGITTE